MRARHYAPTLGRFLQPDPGRGESNTYAYAANTPVTRLDPSGRESWQPNWKEWQICWWSWWACYWWMRDSAFALFAARPIASEWTENAYRHCIWQCLLTYHIGWWWAETWGWAHEEYSGASALDKAVDYHNNYVGRLYGQHLWKVTWAAPAEVWAVYFCDAAWRRGELQTVVNGRRVYSNGRSVGRSWGGSW